MTNPTVKHRRVTGAAANPNVLVDGPAWDDEHVVTGLENVDNTSDANKPVSTAQADALALKAPLASPAFTGDGTISGSFTVNGVPSQFGSQLTARGAGAQFEFGHANTGGYGSVLSNDAGVGNPYLLFNGQRGTNNNTYKTVGIKGALLRSDLGGGFIFATVPNANADNQTATTLATLSGSGVLTLTASPIAPTPSAGDNTTKLATTAWVLANAATATPLSDSASGAVGTAIKYAREDHTHPIDATAWTVTAPTVTASAGAFTTVSCTFHYQVVGKTCRFWASVTITNAGTAAADILFTLPVTPIAAQAGAGKETNAVGYQLNWQTVSNVMHIAKYDNTSIIGSGRVCNISGILELA